MQRLLIVAGPVPSGPVWSVEVPTEGLPAPCDSCELDRPGPSYCRTVGTCLDPFPVTVGRWGEVCSACSQALVYGQCVSHDAATPKVGAVTHLVTVVGPTHHSSFGGPQGQGFQPQLRCPSCLNGRDPDSPHTPVGEVVALDPPHPMERPRTEHRAAPWCDYPVGTHAADCDREEPASFWWGVLPDRNISTA